MVNPEDSIGTGTDNGGMSNSIQNSTGRGQNGRIAPHPVRFTIGNWLTIIGIAVGLLVTMLGGVWKVVDNKMDSYQTKQVAESNDIIKKLEQQIIDERQDGKAKETNAEITKIKNDINEIQQVQKTQAIVLDAVRYNVEQVSESLSDRGTRKLPSSVLRDLKRMKESDP